MNIQPLYRKDNMGWLNPAIAVLVAIVAWDVGKRIFGAFK